MTSQHTGNSSQASTTQFAVSTGQRDAEPWVAPPTLTYQLWRHKAVIATAVILGIFLGLLVTAVQADNYVSETRVFFSSESAFDPFGNGSPSTDPTRFLENQAALMTSEPVLARAMSKDSSVGSLKDIQDTVSATASDRVAVVTLRATAHTGPQAAARLLAVVDSYRDSQRAAIASRVTSLAELGTADERRGIEQRAAAYGDGISIIEPAVTREVSPLTRNSTVGGLVGLLLALAWTLGRRATVSSKCGVGRPTKQDQRAEGDEDWKWEWVR